MDGLKGVDEDRRAGAREKIVGQGAVQRRGQWVGGQELADRAMQVAVRD